MWIMVTVVIAVLLLKTITVLVVVVVAVVDLTDLWYTGLDIGNGASILRDNNDNQQ